MALSRFVLTANVTIPWPATWSEVIQGAANVPVTAPAVPATTVAASNATGVPVAVTITAAGATITAVTVSGTTAGTAAGGYVVPYPGSIAISYTGGPPTWAWAAAELPQSGSSSMTAGVSATAPAGGQAGTIPQFTFLAGTAIYADSAAGSNGPQQLYQAIGSSNLRAYVQGQDDVGHAALSNLSEVISTVYDAGAVWAMVRSLFLWRGPAHFARSVVAVAVLPIQCLTRRSRPQLTLDVLNERGHVMPGLPHADPPAAPVRVMMVVRPVAAPHHRVVRVVERVSVHAVDCGERPGGSSKMRRFSLQAAAGLVGPVDQTGHRGRDRFSAVTQAHRRAPAGRLGRRCAELNSGFHHHQPAESLAYFYEHARLLTGDGASHGFSLPTRAYQTRRTA